MLSQWFKPVIEDNFTQKKAQKVIKMSEQVNTEERAQNSRIL